MNAVIETESLTKSFGERTALDALDLTVPAGSIFGLVGRNGAGKTTTLRLLLGLLEPTSGAARLFGEDARSLGKATRQRIGYLSEEPFPYGDLAFSDAVQFVSGFFTEFDWTWVDHLCERLRVDKAQRLDKMSKGQRRIAELLLAVAHQPELLILDDPAVAVDATVRRDVLWTLLETVQEQGSTVVFSSHILQDVERVVDRVAILRAGKLELAGDLDDLKGRVRRLVLPSSALQLSEPLPGEVRRESLGSEVAVVTTAFAEGMEKRWPGAQVQPMNLEEIFLAITADGEAV